MTRIDRRALFASGSAAAVLAAVGVSAKPAPVQGGHLRAALSGASRTDAWTVPSQGVFMRCAKACVFEALTVLGADGTLRPGLASKWQSTSSAKIWQFKIDNTARFHSGRRVMSADVVAALAAHRDLLPDGLEIKEQSQSVVEFVLKTPMMDFPLHLAQPDLIVFRKAGGLIEGTGPYQIERFQAGRDFKAVAVPNHRLTQTHAWFDTVEFVALSDASQRIEAVISDLVDVADIPPSFDGVVSEAVQVIRRAGKPDAVARKTILHPDRLGRRASLDDGNFAVRWWLNQTV